jgi:diguanylate cyclase (GGDEF)-like protein/PAS domain S-box-containing protein
MQVPQNLLSVTLQSIRDAVVTTDQAGRVQMLNRAAESMTGWSSAEAAGKPVEEVVELRKSGSGSLLPSPAHTALRDGAPVDQAEHSMLIGKDGCRTTVQITASPLHDSAGQIEGCVLILHDVNEALRLAERISYLTHHDPLTGLPNRILLVDRMEQGTKFADRNNDQVAVIFVDLDHFSEIKVSLGNALADDMLKEAAFRMIAALRESDTICRLGGDEFVMMVPGVKSLADVEAVAAKIVEEIAKPFLMGEQTIHATCSIGISVYPRDASDAETLMRLADGAMHQAKRDGRNRYLFAKLEAERVQPIA